MRNDTDVGITSLFIEHLIRWIVWNGSILDGIAGLRGLGDQADAAVRAVLDVREMRRLRASWELWLAIAEDGIDPEAVLLEALPVGVLANARFALWGSATPARGTDCVRLV